jgi:glycosyltransferase involved in cell wall biosynthesis
MKIAVCIPTFNRSDDLIICLRSLLATRIKPSDIFVFDNYSSREHKYKISQFMDQHSINVTFNDENIGLSRNLEKCLAVIDYDYLIIFEDHDVAEPNFISCLKSFAKNYPNASLIVPERKYINSDGKYLSSSRPRYMGEIKGEDFIKSELRKFTFPFPMCVMIKAKYIKPYNLKRFNWYGDIYAWLSLALTGSIVFTNKHLYFSRAREKDHPLNTQYMKSIKEINKVHKFFIKDNIIKRDILGALFFLISKYKKILLMESKIKIVDRNLPLPLHFISKLARWVYKKAL